MPLLHTLFLVDDASLSEDFLGRIPGRLTTMHAERLYIRAPCPSLSTLTTLRATLSYGMTLQDIFAICPRLQTLSLRHIAREHVTEIGLPPHSLSTLVLSTGDFECDLFAVYEACKGSVALRDVELCRYTLGFPLNLGGLIRGAVELRVELPDPCTISVTAHYTGDRKLTISWLLRTGDLGAKWPRGLYPPIFVQPSPCFDQLRTVSLPIAVLPSFIGDGPVLPELETLCLQIAPGTDASLQHGKFQWSDLDVLRDFDLPRIVLKITRPHGPTADDARSLLEYLSSHDRLPAIIVTGFAANAIPDDVRADLSVTFISNE